ncbi:MAG TPA: outer membrane beta-barrel protein [Saprospiraceae bacterium]|nr:outer membrane beta-barrel protein [Saprospiraceae bacterium]
MKIKYALICAVTFLSVLKANTQTTDTIAKLIISGYVDAYYAYYTDSVGVNNYQKFPSISSRSNQIGLNSALISFQYNAEKVRGIATFHFGDTPKSTWSPSFNYIMEAHAGVRLCKKLWLDAGFFRTHFGTEGLLPKENITSSIAVHTFYEPYYEAGIRLNYNPSERLAINLYALNGYNVYEDNNDKKSFGLLATYALSDKGNIGYSNYIGDDSNDADPVSHLRIHQNLFFNYQINKLKLQLGLDYCMQENSELDHNNKTASMFSSIFALKYQLKPKFAVYGRVEYFNDPDGFMSTIITNDLGEGSGYKLFGGTLGVEFKPTDNSYIRLEGRQLVMDKEQKIFYWDGEASNTRSEVLFNVGVSF